MQTTLKNSAWLLLSFLLCHTATAYVYSREPRLEKGTKLICDKEPIGTLVPNPTACNAFFKCTEYEPEYGNCPENMQFNADTSICDFEENVTCNIFEDEADEEMDCPYIDDTNVVLYKPSKLSCGRYYICYSGYPTMLTCKTGLWWSQDTLMCDTPGKVKCDIMGDETITETVTSAPSVVDSTVDVIAVTTTTAVVTGSVTRFDCPNTGDSFIPHPVNCNWFFYCKDGISSLQQCPFLQYFDVDKRRCVFRNEARCALAVRRERI